MLIYGDRNRKKDDIKIVELDGCLGMPVLNNSLAINLRLLRRGIFSNVSHIQSICLVIDYRLINLTHCLRRFFGIFDHATLKNYISVIVYRSL